ncbi:MAG: TetR/AcrR family transcriptional regulator [Alphaproteobacteria bacterium]|nr:TetR/AcrR family transcriptional regulator [Alphaproteobacteria bacterium]
MARPPGRRSHDYDEKRAALARQVFECVLADASTSLKAMADHAGVSRPTLRHYFGDRDGAVQAALEAAATVGAPHVEALRALPVDDPRSTLEEALRRVVVGWRVGVGNVHAVGIKVGLDHPGTTGRTYVGRILEPLLQGVEHLLGRMVTAGTLAALDPRLSALSLVSPVVLALLHQDGLGGALCRPLDVDALPARIAGDFCRLHAPDGGRAG